VQIFIAENAGFCFGVERAYKIVQDTIAKKQKNDSIVTFGPLIHNNRVIYALKNQGVIVKNNINEITDKDTVIIRSHGISSQKTKQLKKRCHHLVDATCPFVKKIYQIAQKFAEKNYQILVIGNKDHPEIQSITEDFPHVFSVQTEIEAQNINLLPNTGVIVQTTFKKDLFQKIAKILQKRFPKIKLENTICHATMIRQETAAKLSQKVDCMIVIGGKQSANTQRLQEICSQNCPTQKIENLHDLDVKEIKTATKVGITAGASTPKNQIDEIVDFLIKLKP